MQADGVNARKGFGYHSVKPVLLADGWLAESLSLRIMDLTCLKAIL